jgi:HNH endonuclease
MIEGKKIAEHRHIVEELLGRKLVRDDVVHHVDGDPLNNDPDNLIVLSRSEHMRLHMKGSRPKRWTPEEKQRAQELRDAGMTYQEIATLVARPFITTRRLLTKPAKESRIGKTALAPC